MRQILDMTKQQAKQFAKIWVGQLLWEVKFDRDSIDCTDEDKDLIQAAIQEQFFKLMGRHELLTIQEAYDLITSDDSL